MKAPERIWAVYTSDFPELPIHTADLEPFPDAVRTVEYLRSDLAPDKERDVAVLDRIENSIRQRINLYNKESLIGCEIRLLLHELLDVISDIKSKQHG